MCILLKDDIALNVLEQLKSKFIKKNSSWYKLKIVIYIP